jgi:serine/threonine-protein kinase
MLGRYQVLKPLAKGGMAEVLLARAIGLKGFARHVVIKRIRVENKNDHKAIDMFLDEARLVASLHHRNIVQVHDVGEEEGKYFFVMEYVHGCDTRELLRHVKEAKEQIPLEHIITLVTSAAAGLHYAHELRGPDRMPLGIVHRDISPGNILLGYDGDVKVVDFGIAKLSARKGSTQPGVLMGKVGYMSPEQCLGTAIDRRTDIFLLGIVLWELCTVRRLFNKENRGETMSAIVEANVPPPSQYRQDLPPELSDIALKALAKDPADRYQTADELRVVLESVAASHGIPASPGRLGDYLKQRFGTVPEPWLASDIPKPDEQEVRRRSSPSFSTGGSYIGKPRTETGLSHPAAPPPSRARRSTLIVVILLVLAGGAAVAAYWLHDDLTALMGT